MRFRLPLSLASLALSLLLLAGCSQIAPSAPAEVVPQAAQTQLVAWGNNGFGQTDLSTIPEGATYTAVSAGADHSLALQPEPEPQPEPETGLYTLDFEKVPVDRLVYGVTVGKGITYSGNGTPNQGLIRVAANRFLNGKTLNGNQAKVIRVNGDKRLTVAKFGTNTPNPQGGLLILSPNTTFAPPASGGRNGLVTLKSITIRGVESSGKLILRGNGALIQEIPLERTRIQTLTPNVSGVGTIQIVFNDDFTLDDVVLEVPATPIP